jgi:hypothetical protein
MPKSVVEGSFPHNLLSQTEEGKNVVENDRDGAREQFAIASIILQLSQQCNQPQAKKRRGRDLESVQMPEQICSSQDHHLSQNVHLFSNDQSQSDLQSKVKKNPVSELFMCDFCDEQIRSDLISSSSTSMDVNGVRRIPSTSFGVANAKLSMDTADSNTDDSARDGGSSWAVMDEFVSEGVSNYCASVSSEEDKGAKSELRRTYRCSKCGAEKKGHVCSAKAKELSASSPTLGVSHCHHFLISYLIAAMFQMKRGDLAARLAARLNAHAGGSSSSSSNSIDSAQYCGYIGSSSMVLNRSGSTGYVRGGGVLDNEVRWACSLQVEGEREGERDYAAQDALDGAPPPGPLARLPFFRSFRAGDWVHTPGGVGLSLVGSWAPPIPSS